jgi:hypothetical protein
VKFNKNIRNHTNEIIEGFGSNDVDDEILTKTILNTYKKYQDNNVINFRNVKDLDFDIKNMQTRIGNILNTLSSQYKNHFNKSVLMNTNGVITGA